MTPISLGQLDFHIPITPLVIFALAALVLLAWSVFTVVVRYHWKHYGTGKLEIFTMNFFYLIGSAIFIALIVIVALLFYYSSLNV